MNTVYFILQDKTSQARDDSLDKEVYQIIILWESFPQSNGEISCFYNQDHLLKRLGPIKRGAYLVGFVLQNAKTGLHMQRWTRSWV